METPNGKRRPGLVVSRNEAIPVLNNLVVAPVTTTIRNIPTCIPVGTDEGLDHDSVATFDNLASVPKSILTTRLGALGHSGRRVMCNALSALADCSPPPALYAPRMSETAKVKSSKPRGEMESPGDTVDRSR